MQKNKRVVVKVGTKVITAPDKALDKEKIRDIAGQIADIQDRGAKVIVVTSGAIGAGMGLLGLKKRPTRLAELQATASIGQSHLMHLYSEAFKSRGYLVGQILLTQEDFNDRRRYLNINYTIQTLLNHKVIPIINENDTVSTEEIKCGDNDRLSSLVSDLCHADTLILLTDVDGLLNDEDQVIGCVEEMTSKVLKLARVSHCDLGTGGMATKLEAVKRATGAGIECVIANGKKKDILLKIMEGEMVGTRFKTCGARFIAKKRWIAFSSRPKGAIVVDIGARDALIKKNKSLLASGVVGIEGDFVAGEVIKICAKDGKEFARGISAYSSGEVVKIKALKTDRIKDVLGYKGPDEVVHKDNLVIL